MSATLAARGSAARCPARARRGRAPRRSGRAVAVRAEIAEVTSADFDVTVAGAKDAGALLVVDCYTDWCGPCKMIYPELQKLDDELGDKARFVKLNCNQANKELAKGMGVKSVPTFFLYKEGEMVDMMTGAKIDALRALIDKHV